MNRLRGLHRDEHGTISVLSVIVLVLLTMLLGMILNVGEQIDDKIKLQNAADAATYSSGVVVARGMNSIAFTNHLLSETFALTAYFREGRDRYAEALVPEVLDAWEVVGQQLSAANFQLFRNMQPAISPKVQLERDMVKAFGDMTAIKARLLLPALETILGVPETQPITSTDQQRQISQTHLIPEFQRAVVLAIPTAAAAVSQEITTRNTVSRQASGAQCLIWNSQVFPVQSYNQTDPYQRLLPGLDPSFEGPDFIHLNLGEAGMYQAQAVRRRDQLAKHYLDGIDTINRSRNGWINDPLYDLAPFARERSINNPHYDINLGGMVSAKMSQFKRLYWSFACAKLNILLRQEFPTTNLPHMLRAKPAAMTQQQWLENEYTFTGAIYRKQRAQTMPGMYRPLIQGDALAFARVSVYLPRRQFVTHSSVRFCCPPFVRNGITIFPTPCYNNWPQEWTLFNQHWAAKMMPTSAESTVTLLQTPPVPYATGVTLPNFNGITVQDLRAVNTH